MIVTIRAENDKLSGLIDEESKDFQVLLELKKLVDKFLSNYHDVGPHNMGNYLSDKFKKLFTTLTEEVKKAQAIKGERAKALVFVNSRTQAQLISFLIAKYSEVKENGLLQCYYAIGRNPGAQTKSFAIIKKTVGRRQQVQLGENAGLIIKS